MISERINDGIERPAAQWFKRYNGKTPEKGGAQKTEALKPKAWLEQTREAWADHANRALERAGHDARIDHRTLEAQGIERLPGVHLGPNVVEMEGRGIRTDRADVALNIDTANAQIIDLQEYAGERMLSHIVAEHGDYQATEIAAELMAKLYAASEEPLPSALLPIRDRFAALFQRARDDQNAGCQTDYVHAAIIADQMMSNASELRGLHGDLHHENIMFSSRGWLVIDPVGLVGEPSAQKVFLPCATSPSTCRFSGVHAFGRTLWPPVPFAPGALAWPGPTL